MTVDQLAPVEQDELQQLRAADEQDAGRAYVLLVEHLAEGGDFDPREAQTIVARAHAQPGQLTKDVRELRELRQRSRESREQLFQQAAAMRQKAIAAGYLIPSRH